MTSKSHSIPKASDETIHIVCMSSYEHSLHFQVLLQSLIENHTSGENLQCHIIHNWDDPAKKGVIEAQWVSEKRSLRWIAYTKNTSVAWKDHVLLQLLKVLGPDVPRVIFLTEKALVAGEISALWHISLQGHILGAIPDEFEGNNASFFRPGVLLLDVHQWHKDGISKTLEQEYTKSSTQVISPGLEPVQRLFSGQYLPLPTSWNHMHYALPETTIDLVNYDSLFSNRATPYDHWFYSYAKNIDSKDIISYPQLKDIPSIQKAEELPKLMEHLGITSLKVEKGKTLQAITVEPPHKTLTKTFLDANPNLSIVRLWYKEGIEEEADEDTAHIEAYKSIFTTYKTYGGRFSLVRTHKINAHQKLAFQGYPFVYIDTDAPLAHEIDHTSSLLYFLPPGGIMSGCCTQEHPLRASDFDIFKHNDIHFDVNRQDIRIHQDVEQSNRWFWYFMKMY